MEGKFFYDFFFCLSTASYLLPGGFVAGVTGRVLGEDAVKQDK